MSVFHPRRTAALALAAALALGVAGCFPPPYAMRPVTATPAPGPVIENFTVSPAFATKDAVITFGVSARDRDGKALKYEWTTGIGTLSSKTGKTVTWRPPAKGRS